MPERVVVALGGHALIKPGQQGTIEEQCGNLDEALPIVVELIREGLRVLITHGNGPQVGHILLRAEAARGQAYDLPLDVCVAQSQGEIGYLIEQRLAGLLRRSGLAGHAVVSVLTRVVVDRDDPHMQKPTKPIGPFYTADQVPLLHARGWAIVEEAKRGYRRMVPSPRPLQILETVLIERLLDCGATVIAAGGGGIPVSVGENGAYAGLEAVIDKDFTSGLLATAIGARQILSLTAVEYVKLNFGQASERDLPRLTVDEAARYLAAGHFAQGSMGPKIEAAIQFLERGGQEVIITLPEKALRRDSGTHLFPQ